MGFYIDLYIFTQSIFLINHSLFINISQFIQCIITYYEYRTPRLQGISQSGALIGGYLLSAGVLKLLISTYWTICIFFDIFLVYIWFRYFFTHDSRANSTGANELDSVLPLGGGSVSDIVSFDLSDTDNPHNNVNNDDVVRRNNDGDVEAGELNNSSISRNRNRNNSHNYDLETDFPEGRDDQGDFDQGLSGSESSRSWSSFIGRSS